MSQNLMNPHIKNIVPNDKKHSVIYKKETLITNQNTGEVMQTVQETIAREPNKERFLKIFVNNIVAYQNMSEAENVLFYQIIKNHMNLSNIVYFTNVIRSTVISNKLMAKSTFYRAKEGLINKKILLPLDREKQQELQKGEEIPIFAEEVYLVNPNIIGQGSFRDLKKLRQVVETNFDFETGEAIRSIQTETSYVGLDEVKEEPESFEVKSITHENNNNKDIKTEVIVGEKKRGRKAKENKEEVIDAEVVEKEPTLFNDVAENAPIDNQQETTQTDQVANNELETKELLELKEKVLALEIEKQKNDLRAKLIDAGKIEEALKI